MGRIRTLFSLPRYDYEIWSNNRLVAEGWGANRGKVMFDFEYWLDATHHGKPVGEGFTLIVRKASRG